MIRSMKVGRNMASESQMDGTAFGQNDAQVVQPVLVEDDVARLVHDCQLVDKRLPVPLGGFDGVEQGLGLVIVELEPDQLVKAAVDSLLIEVLETVKVLRGPPNRAGSRWTRARLWMVDEELERRLHLTSSTPAAGGIGRK